MRVVNPIEMREIEKVAKDEYGFDEGLIIENVGAKGSEFIDQVILEEYSFGEIVILAGMGNNASDALAIGRGLVNRGHSVRAFMLFPDQEYGDELKKQMMMAERYGVKFTDLKSIEPLMSYFESAQDQFLIIDGVFGTGLRLPISNYINDIFNLVNDYSSITISIDIASGVTGDVGEMSSTAIKADYTLAIGMPKTGHYISYGAMNSGKIYTLDVGFPAKLKNGGDKALLTHEGIVNIYQSRSKFAHKNTFGHSLIIGGSRGLTGALVMASTASLKVGTGLVTAVTWRENYPELVSRIIPEVMTGSIPETKADLEEELKALRQFDSIVVGPGLGRSEQTRQAVLNVLEHFYGPVIIDADAIHMLDYHKDVEYFRARKGGTILTPHIGEFAKFVGLPVEEVLKRPISLLKEAVDRTSACIILKGACTYLGFPTGDVLINYFPNDGMASGGSGDVLAGMIGGLAAQNAPDPTESGIFSNKDQFYQGICLAVAAHTLAGKSAAEKLGVRAMTAGSIIDHLPKAFFEMKREE